MKRCGRLHSILKELEQDHLQLTEMRDVMHRLYVMGMSRADVASLAPLVSRYHSLYSVYCHSETVT